MSSYQDKYLGLVIDDRETSTHILFERLADGKGLDCKIILAWEKNGILPLKKLPNRIRLVIYAIDFDKKKTEFTINGYIFGDLPIGLKSGKYQLVFNRYSICENLPDEMYESENAPVFRISEMYDPFK